MRRHDAGVQFNEITWSVPQKTTVTEQVMDLVLLLTRDIEGLR